MAKNAVATQQSGNVPANPFAATEWDDYQGPTGSEDMTSKDVAIPRLKLCQALSEEVKSNQAQSGDVIHSITKVKIGGPDQPFKVICLAWSDEFILWKDRNDGGGIMARARRGRLPDGTVVHQWDKPFTKFQTRAGKIQVEWKTGKTVEDDGLGNMGTSIEGQPDSPPAATRHHNYLVMMPEMGYAMLAMSLSKTGESVARQLNQMLKEGRAPVWARVFDVHIVKVKKDSNEWWQWQFKPAGLLRRDDPVLQNLEEMHKTMAEKGINVDFSDAQGSEEDGDNKGF